MPTRKKKKLDLGLANQRDAKKKRRLEKHIRRIIVKGRKLKPIDEIEGTQDILNTLTYVVEISVLAKCSHYLHLLP